ncbi:MAG: hypothetical protein A3F72_01945 [Bacteroidetes bacterium RIFCSPLOWO2_12_FULL_35_15]|nr:MAG: hypothetical protein A3F72_01945 [Bacteroidetes bacterium RIFCSPLOWO2_12_FULL_35_15]
MRSHFKFNYIFLLFLAGVVFNEGLAQSNNNDTLAPKFRRVYLLTGIGFPEFLNANLGCYINRKISLDADYGIVIFNSMLGVGATYYFYGKKNISFKHSFLVAAKVRTNPDNHPLKLKSGGETLGSILELYAGYNYSGKKGFMFRGQVGPLFTIESDHIGFGFNSRLCMGYSF